MKNLLKFTAFIFLLTNVVVAQKNRGIFGETNWTENWTNYKPKSTFYRETEFVLNGDLKENTTLSRKNCYLIAGNVVVKSGATLTIESGTIIKGDYATTGSLIIEQGAKIIAEGSETSPIVFTSNRAISDRNPGDWGGIIILGKAPVNKLGGKQILDLNEMFTFGGSDIADNSGVLKYVRIEFAGKRLKGKYAFDALTLAGVGNMTKIENVQTSFSQKNGFSFLGGNLKVTKLVSFKNYIHDYNFNAGTNTTITNSLAFRFPNYSDASYSNALNVQSYDDITQFDFSKKSTTVKAANLTIISLDDEKLGNVREAVYVAENTNFTFTKSIIHGFSPAILLDKRIESAKLNNIVIQNMLFNQCKDAIVYDVPNFSANLVSLYGAENFLNEFKMLDITELLSVPDFKSNSNFGLKVSVDNNVVIKYK